MVLIKRLYKLVAYLSLPIWGTGAAAAFRVKVMSSVVDQIPDVLIIHGRVP